MAHDRKNALTALRRIEGQVRGIAGMVEEDRYCVDIVTQISAVRAALKRVESNLLRQHMEHCVRSAMTSDDPSEQARVIDELMTLYRKQ